MSDRRDSDPALSAAREFGDRSRLATDASFYDAPGSSRVSHLPQQAPDPVRDGFSGTVDVAPVLDSRELDQTSAQGSQGVGMEHSGMNDLHIPALTAVSYHPRAMDDELSLPQTPEVVSAVMERGQVFRRGSPSDQRNAQRSSSSPPTELYISDSEMSDALGDLSAPGPYAPSSDVDMEAIVQHLIHNTAIGHSISTIEKDSDSDYDDDLVMDYESAMLRDMSTPSTPREDDPDDTRKFYLDDDDDDDGYTERSHLQWSGSQLSEVDFDDFYRSFDYESSSQLTDTAFPSVQDDGNYTSDNEGAAGEEMNDAGIHFLASAVHGTSMTPALPS